MQSEGSACVMKKDRMYLVKRLARDKPIDTIVGPAEKKTSCDRLQSKHTMGIHILLNEKPLVNAACPSIQGNDLPSFSRSRHR